jgi:hypothetical protein
MRAEAVSTFSGHLYSKCDNLRSKDNSFDADSLLTPQNTKQIFGALEKRY